MRRTSSLILPALLARAPSLRCGALAARAALLAAAAAAGCSEAGRTPADLVIPVFSQPESRDGGHFGTHMTGAEETPPRPSRAQGQLNLRLLRSFAGELR